MGLARLPGDRGDAGQARGLGPADAAELGHVDEELGGGDRPDAGNGAKDLPRAGEAGIGGDPGGDLGIEGGDLAEEQPLAGAGEPAEQRARRGPRALAGEVAGERPAGGEQVLELAQVLRRGDLGFESEGGAHPRQHLRVALTARILRDPVGLGQPAAALGEAARASSGFTLQKPIPAPASARSSRR